MEWLFPSVVATMVGTFILAATYLFLYRFDPQRFLKIWAYAWCLYALRFTCMLGYLTFSAAKPFFLIGNQLAALWSGIALLWGTYSFIGRDIPRNWNIFGLLMSAYIIVAGLKSSSLLLLSLPIFLFLGWVYLWTGVIFFGQKRFSGNLSMTVGVLFVIWGIHKADYPFLRPIAWFAPWGYLLGAMLELCIALGMLMLYFQQAQQQLRESEDRFRSIFENAVEGFFQSTPEGQFVNVNPAFAEMLGYASPEELIASIADIGTQIYSDPRDRRRFQRLLRDQGRVQNLEFKVKRRDGETIWIANSTRAVYDGDGNTVLYEGTITDITERKKLEHRLRRQHYLFEKAQEIGQIGAWELDGATGDLQWSSELYAIFHIEAGSKLTYERFLDCVHPDDRKDVDQAWQAALAGQPYDIEHRILAGRAVKWIREKAELRYDDDGAVFGAVGFAQDITDRKIAEIQRQESTERFKAIFDSQLDAIFVLSATPPLVIVECNHSASSIFGYDAGALIGRSINILFPIDSLRRNFEPDRFDSSDGTAHVNGIHAFMITKDGTRFPAELSFIPMTDRYGVRTGWIWVVRNLSEVTKARDALIESEAKFKTLYDNAPVSYQSLDENGCFLEVNQTWLAILGYEKSDVIGKHFSNFIHPDWRDHFKINFPKFKSIGEILGVEFEMVKKDGSTILVSFHGKISKAADGAFKQTHCVFWDLTEKRRIEREREEIERRLNQMQKMESIGNLAGGIAHDFNNLLFPIVGMSEMLMEDLPPDSPQYESAMEIFKAGLRGGELVKQILTFSRQSEHKKIPTRVQSVLDEVVKLSRATIPSNINIQEDIQSDCGFVLADPIQIHQVAMNIITNAYHAVEDNGGTIFISLKETIPAASDLPNPSLKPNTPALLLNISDTGHGIRKDQLDKIFDPYFTTKEQGKGTGLGLAVVHGIVKEHGGAIKVASELKKGTTFHVYLPLMDQTDTAKQVALTEEIPVGREHILLVDDEEATAMIETQMLERLGYRVTERNNSPDALKEFKTNPDSFDLVITDMTMPNMTGDQLAKELKSIRPTIPVIICTGFSEKMNQQRAKNAGISGLLMKPVVKADMGRMVRKVLDEANAAAIQRSSF